MWGLNGTDDRFYKAKSICSGKGPKAEKSRLFKQAWTRYKRTIHLYSKT